MSPPREQAARALDEAAIWQEVEFGSYTADLRLWAELAEGGERPGARARVPAPAG